MERRDIENMIRKFIDKIVSKILQLKLFKVNCTCRRCGDVKKVKLNYVEYINLKVMYLDCKCLHEREIDEICISEL